MTAPAPSPLGQSLLASTVASLESAAEANRKEAEGWKYAYVVTLKGSGEERVCWDESPPGTVYGRGLDFVFGRRFLRFSDDSLLDPAEIASMRPMTRDEAEELEEEPEEIHPVVVELRKALAAMHGAPPTPAPIASPAPVEAPK